jgi:tRNA (mo5U34)-methyltransferase
VARATLNASSQAMPARRPEPSSLEPDARALIELVAAVEWRDTIDLGHDVVTPGTVDLRGQIELHGLPSSLAGMRCLDASSGDGFWAFEMERRGAAEVVSVDVSRLSDKDMAVSARRQLLEEDLDKDTDAGFKIAQRALGSRVVRTAISAYALSPQTVGQFDLVFASDLLKRFRDPQLVLDRMRSVCRGTLYAAEDLNEGLEPLGDACLAEYSLSVDGQPSWWYPNRNTVARMVSMAGFEAVEEVASFALETPGLPARPGRRPRVVFAAHVPETARPEHGSIEAAAR